MLDDARKWALGAIAGAVLMSLVLKPAFAWASGRLLGPVQLVKVDGVWMTTAQHLKWIAMRDAAAASGVTLRLNSGFRTYGEQAVLYERFRTGAGNPANQPGWSNHQNGKALDIDGCETPDKPAFKWLTANAGRFGWRRTVAREPWHWEID